MYRQDSQRVCWDSLETGVTFTAADENYCSIFIKLFSRRRNVRVSSWIRHQGRWALVPRTSPVGSTPRERCRRQWLDPRPQKCRPTAGKWYKRRRRARSRWSILCLRCWTSYLLSPCWRTHPPQSPLSPPCASAWRSLERTLCKSPDRHRSRWRKPCRKRSTCESPQCWRKTPFSCRGA